MDRYELLGFVLQYLRDNREPDEEDIGLAVLRETTKILELMVRFGHLTRAMFDLTGIVLNDDGDGLPERYARYQTTSYPANFVCFADRFAEWLLGEDPRPRLDYVDLIRMIEEWTLLRVSITRSRDTTIIVVRSQTYDDFKFRERVIVKDSQRIQ